MDIDMLPIQLYIIKEGKRLCNKYRTHTTLVGDIVGDTIQVEDVLIPTTTNESFGAFRNITGSVLTGKLSGLVDYNEDRLTIRFTTHDGKNVTKSYQL